MSDLWLDGDVGLTAGSLHLSVDQFIDESLAAKRQLYLANSSSWICKFFQKNACMRGQECPYRHSRGDKPTVCKYWLRGSCKKGAELCESLHVYDLSKMQMCQFIVDYGSCSNADCLFNHVKPEVEEVDCIWYGRGFCRHGPKCKNRHRKREMCPDYLAGFWSGHTHNTTRARDDDTTITQAGEGRRGGWKSTNVQPSHRKEGTRLLLTFDSSSSFAVCLLLLPVSWVLSVRRVIQSGPYLKIRSRHQFNMMHRVKLSRVRN